MLDAALEYVRHGLLVFPCREDKAPATKHGFEDATSDTRRIRAWWKAMPDALVGVAVPEGVVVLDVDPRNGGDATIRALAREHRPDAFPATRVAATAGGGTHRWYAVDPALDLRAKLGVGVDVKRHGKGYVIAPPSRVGDREYRWRNGGLDREVADAPAWLVEELTRAPREAAVTGDASIPDSRDGTAYGERALDLELEKLRGARPGERNDALNAAAFALAQLVAGGELREEPVREMLLVAAETLDLPRREAEATVESGFAAGLSEPRHAPARDDQDLREETAPSSLLELLGPRSGGPGEATEEGLWLDWTGEPEDPEWIVEPLLPRGAYVLVFGAAEAAKSMILAAVGAEASRRGFSVSVYSLENPSSVDRQRLQRLEPDSENFRLSNQGLNLADARQVMAMAERERGRDLVVIDTYAHAFAQRYDSGDGNARAIEFARVVRWLMRQTGATFVVVDHTGFERPGEPRDASAKRQQVDVAVGMERTRDWKLDEPMHFRAHNYKAARFGNPFTIDGMIVGRTGEPLSVRWERGAALKWGEPR